MKARVGAPFFKRNGEAIPPPHGRTLSLESGNAAFFVACILNSSLFYWYYSLLSDCEHVNDGLVRGFPIPEDWASSDWAGMAVPLQERLDLSSTRKRIRTKQGHTIEYDELNASAAKKEMDAVDSALASVYGLSAVEFDHLISFDIKYRMGDALAVTG